MDNIIGNKKNTCTIRNKKNTCTACEFIKNGVKTRKHIEHTCSMAKKYRIKKIKQTV